MILSLLIFFTLILKIVEPCSSGSGCCSSRKSPPPVASCGNGVGCQQGYGCGQYGCAKRKAFSSLTKRIDGIIVDIEDEEEAHMYSRSKKLMPEESNSTYEQHLNPNFIFHACCQARGLPDSCLQLCHFNTYTSRALEAIFQKRNQCPIEAINEIHYCAAQGIDHRDCCASNGVGRTSAGDKCLAFCDQRPNKLASIDSGHLPCFGVFERMKKCFFFEIKKRSAEKFGWRAKSNGELFRT